MMTDNFTDAQKAALAKVKKLMALADDARGNENEAANATAMAQTILASLNLSMDDLGKAGQNEGREDTKLVGGFYQHERDMWEAIAELNFCYYWTVKVRYDTETAKRENRKWAHHHRLVGRSVNILSTKLMADYLLKTVERLTKQYVTEETMEKWHPRSETSISFRKGAAARLIEKIKDRRIELLREEKRKQREQDQRASHPAAAPTANALVVTNLTKSEAASNYDFMNGEGAWERKLARHKEWEERWERDQAAIDAEHERRMRDDPKYRRQFEREQERAERRWEREGNRAEKAPANNMRAFRAGERAAADVSLDRQVKSDPLKRIG